MRILTTLFCVLGALLFLSACSGGTSDTISQQDTTTIDLGPMGSLESIPERYSSYEGFPACIAQSVARCDTLGETSIASSTWNNLIVSIGSMDSSKRDAPELVSCVERGVDQCMMEAAGYTGDRSAVACDEYLSTESRESCQFSDALSRAIQSRDPTLCESLSEDALERCKGEVNMIVAVQTGDMSACDTLQEADKVACNNRVIMQRAMDSQDIELCDGIMDPYRSEAIADMRGMPYFERDMCRERVEMMGGGQAPQIQ